MWQIPIFGVLLLSCVVNCGNGDTRQLFKAGAERRVERMNGLPVARAARGFPGIVRSNNESFVDMAVSSGYEAEEHSFTTADGYILKAHRIPGGPKSPSRSGKPVIILMHGLFGASDIWLIRGPKTDLAYLLVDEGYDVWAYNARGNYYSRRHSDLSPEKPEFWRFSWHECGIYDMPAMIDYILDLTGMENVSLIGHSMGTTIEFVLLSMRPEYNEKVNVAICLAPVVNLTHWMPAMLQAFTINYGVEIEKILKLIGMLEIFPRQPLDIAFITSLCEWPIFERLCQTIIFYFCGSADYEQFDSSIIPTLLNHYPQGSSIETLQHYRQILLSGKFTQFDFGMEGNYEHYGSHTVPQYPLHKVTAPVVLYYGKNDPFSTELDVRALERKLPNVASKEILHPQFNHLDFVFAKDSKVLIFDDIIALLNEHSRNDLVANSNGYQKKKLNPEMSFSKLFQARNRVYDSHDNRIGAIGLNRFFLDD